MVKRAPKPEAGVALVIVLLAMGLLAATALGLAVSSTITRLTGANHDESVVLANASESALELAARELGMVVNWNNVLLGTQASTLVDGAPGSRSVAPGVSIDLVALTNQLTCGRETLCTDAEVAVTTRERPWGGNNPRWRLFVHQPPPAMPMPSATLPVYIVVWVGDDAAETDGDPLADGAGPGQEGRYIVRARAESFGSRGGRHAIEAELARVCKDEEEAEWCAPGIRVQSWRAVGNSLP
ncbi:MAG TPA: hypothetical protein VMO26_29920 [Vicinamibacterales bacterium]|nr:hypothetical protein [Vicinamibacterales bacterium]